ncbi:MAG: RNA chaperone Hfq [Clostridia bacterium]|nr:RNA chaperone Hfq [Clostridia bacterium]
MKTLILQDIILNTVRRDKLPITLICNGNIRFTGTIRGFDNYTVIIDCESEQIMLYKYNIVAIECTKQILNDYYNKDVE